MDARIRQLAAQFHPRIVEIRRHLHSHPELSWQESGTAAYVAAELDKLGIPYQSGIASNGIVALLRGRHPEKRCIALRADMDALPIQEDNKVPYASHTPGVMHACGHDMHTANLLGTAMILSDLKDEWQGTVKLIFQPSEEKIPSGANAMIEAGVLENPEVQAIYGLHVHPELEVGEVGFRPGQFMASTDELYLTVHGRGGHAAQPARFISPLIISAEILLALQRFTDMSIPTVLSFGKMIAEGATNIIPAKAELAGTLRCFDESTREQIHKEMTAICHDIAGRHGATCDVHILRGYPVVYNNEALTARAKAVAVAQLGAAHVHDLPIRMGAEDFGYYTRLIPA
ncbi:MAG: amidohydrolase, partial [Bacteroidetes bacterium]|nr:amidohydrolase [Bacteroidota bacterium]